MRNCLLSIKLATLEWLHNRKINFCVVIALAFIFTPLLSIYGICNGVLSLFEKNLLRDPSVLVIMPSGSKGGGFSESFIESARNKDGISFIVGRTRDVAAELQLSDGKGKFLSIPLEGTAEGDPLLARAKQPFPNSQKDHLVLDLTEIAAKKLGVKTGDVVYGSMSRRDSRGKIQSLTMPLTVDGIIPSGVHGRETAFISLPLLNAIQDFRDNVTSTFLGIKGEFPPQKERFFESFRAYAKTLDDVGVLTDWFQSQGHNVITKAKEIANLKSLKESVYQIISVITIVSAVGSFIFIYGTVIATVSRQRKSLGLLRLVGFTRLKIMLFPFLQALITSVMGALIAILFYEGISVLVNNKFGDVSTGEAICYIPIEQLGLALIGVVIITFLATLGGALKAFKTDPSDALREI